MADDTVDISSMPAPETIGLSPGASMPAPSELFQKNVGREGSPDEVQNFMTHPENWASGGGAGPGLGTVASRFTGAPRAAAAAALSVPAAVASVAGQVGGALATGVSGDPKYLESGRQKGREWASDVEKFADYVPATPEGAKFAEDFLGVPAAVAKGTVGEALNATIGPNATQAVGDVASDLATDLPVLGVPGIIKGTARAARGAMPRPKVEPVSGSKSASPPPAAVTAEQLRAQPNPIPPPNAEAATAPATLAVQKPKITPRAGESAQAAAVRQGILPAPPESSAAPTAPAAAPESGIGGRQGGAVRLFHPPQEDGPQHAAKASDADQSTRQGVLDEVNRLGGGLMTHDRRGAVTGDWEETGNEHQTAKMPDAAGQLLRDQIASEHQTLHNATQAVHDATGTEALNNVDRDTAEQRGGTVRGAVQAIEDHFNGAANGLYQTARATLGDRPMPSMPRVQQILTDASHDVNPTAASLRRAAQSKLQQLWSVGDTRGNVKTEPGTVGAAERFHEFLNDSYHNDSSGLIRKLKNATDMDVAERAGGNDMFQAARNVIRHRETMLEPDGVNELRSPKDRNKIDNEVPLHGVMDHVVNQDREHFEHFMNVLRAGAHLSPDIAEKSAAAIREIQAHMIAKMHTAARGEAGAWNPTNFYKAANRFSTNMLAAFKENPQLLARLQTINRAGNILKMDKSYPGAVAQAAKTGLIPSLAMKGAKAAEVAGIGGGAHAAGPVGAFAGHMVAKGLKHGAEKLGERSRVAKAQESLIPRGKERGSVRITNNASGESAASQEAISRSEQEEANGQHRWQIDPDGNPTPLRGVNAVDARAPAGHLIVQRGVGSNPKGYTILDRGGLPQSAANGQLARSVGMGKLAAAEKQRGSVRIMRGGRDEYEAPKELQNFIHKVAPAHRVDEHGPTSWDELKASKGQSVMPINPQGAEGSIYKDVPTNIAFRAWHDKLHQDLDAGFDHSGELKVAMEHQRLAKEAGLSDESRRALWADTWETFKHHEDNGDFPDKPREFVARMMKRSFPGDKQRGSVSILNVGHNVGDPAAGGRVLSKTDVARAIAGVGGKISSHDVVHPGESSPNLSEPTSVVGLKTPLSEPQGVALARALGQKSIPQNTGPGEGSMFVPKEHTAEAEKEGWDQYNPDYFHLPDGRNETAHIEDAKHAAENPPEAPQTVKNPVRNAYPGIYDPPKQIMSRVKTVPEDPILKQLFGVSRKDLHDTAVSRMDAEQDYKPPGIKEKGRGAASAKSVMTPENAERLRNVIGAFKDHDPDAYHGMVGWYTMDPLYDKVVEHVDKKAAPAIYSRLNHLMGMASPGSDVATEINRGTGANMMAAKGEFSKFQRYGGQAEGSRGKNFPPEMEDVKGHAYHGTAQSPAMADYLKSGEMQMQSPKVPTYIRSSAVPGQGFQNRVLVGDSHWSRGVGLADTRTEGGRTTKTGATIKPYAGSVSNPELADLHPWYREEVAHKLGLPATSAQAVQWGALSAETGVDTAIGAPKLELFAQQVQKAAKRLGVSPEEALRRIIKGIAHAG